MNQKTTKVTDEQVAAAVTLGGRDDENRME